MGTPSQSYGTSLNCHMGSHSVTCHPTQVKAPHPTLYYWLRPQFSLRWNIKLTLDRLRKFKTQQTFCDTCCSLFWIRTLCIFLLLFLFFTILLVGATVLKSLSSVVSSRIRMKFDRIVVLQVNIHRVTESDFWYDVILSKWRSWRPSAAHCWICSRTVGPTAAAR